MKVRGPVAWVYANKPKPAKKTKKGMIPAQYTLDYIITTKKEAKELKDLGLNVKKITTEIPGIDDSTSMYKLTIKKYYESSNGEINPPPQVVDSKLKPFKGIIGNGSICNVVFRAKEWESPLGSGTAAYLSKIQVLELNAYDDLEDFEEEDGFVAQLELDDDFEEEASAPKKKAKKSVEVDELDDDEDEEDDDDFDL